MPFCTLLYWDSGFDLERYNELHERAGTHDGLPEGCLARIVGFGEADAHVIEVWESDQHAQRFSEKHTPLIEELQIAPPSAVAAFETAIYEARD